MNESTCPSEPIGVPEEPDLRCREHGSVCEVMHSLHRRIVELESRVRELEERHGFR